MDKAQAQFEVRKALGAMREQGGLDQRLPPLTDGVATAFAAKWGHRPPNDLLNLLTEFNGVVGDIGSIAVLYGIPSGRRSAHTKFASMSRQKSFQTRWHKTCFPIASDGCGNTFALVPSPIGGSYWVGFVEGTSEASTIPDAVDYYCASSLWHFLLGEIWVEAGLPEMFAPANCEAYQDRLWPFNRAFAQRFDPDLCKYDGPLAPWHLD